MKNKLCLFLIFILLVAVQVRGQCATKYLRNVGTTNWDVDASWATNADGTGDTTFPTSVDDVVINAVASTTVLTVNVASACKSLDMTDFVGTLAGSSVLDVFGNCTFGSGQTVSYNGVMRLNENGTLTTNTKSLPCQIYIYCNGKTIQLGDHLTMTNVLTMNYGTLVTNNKNITCTSFNMDNNHTGRVVTLGSSTVICNSFLVNNTGLTLTANTSTINCSGAFNGGGLTTYNIVNITNTSTMAGSNTFANLLFSKATAFTGTITTGTTQAITKLFKIDSDPSNKITIASSTSTNATLSSTKDQFIRNAIITDIDVTGGGNWYYDAGSVTMGDGTGWTSSATRNFSTFDTSRNSWNETNNTFGGNTTSKY